MSAEDKKTTIREALHNLGLTSGRVSVLYWRNQARVDVNSRYFGIWDFERRCFVD